MYTEMQNTTENNELKKVFNKTLNSHDYPFQYAVIQTAKEAYINKSSCWVFEASEFPEEANGKSTRIDFVLKSNDKDHNYYYIVAECQLLTFNMTSTRWTTCTENDRISYTISPEARKEVLKRLLKLNHEIHEKEVEQANNEKKNVKKKKESLPLFES